MPVIVIGSSKGGAGKSTLCTHLAARHVNKDETIANKTIVIDADPQKSTCNWSVVRDDLTDVPRINVVEKTGKALPQVIQEMGRHYETVFIDVPGHRSVEFRGALVAADMLLYPVRPSHFDAWVLEQDLSEIIGETRIVNPGLQVMVYMNGLSTNPGSRASQQNDIRAVLRQFTGIYVSPHHVSERAAFGFAGNLGYGVTEMPLRTKKMQDTYEKAVLEINDLYKEVQRCLAGAYPEALEAGVE